MSDCAEEGLVELFPPAAAPGKLMMACMHGGKMSPAQCGAVGWYASMHCRVEAFSLHGGRKWSSFTPVQSLPDTPVTSGVARWEARRALLFSSPDVTRDPCPRHCMNDYGRCGVTLGKDCVGQRNYLTVVASVDNDKTWPYTKLVWPYECHSYSDVNVLPDGRVAALTCIANGTAGYTVNGTGCTAGSVTLTIAETDDMIPVNATGRRRRTKIDEAREGRGNHQAVLKLDDCDQQGSGLICRTCHTHLVSSPS
eukprot:SAG22_NODE_5006_length_1110_cov_1.273986_2_plen_252_part_01